MRKCKTICVIIGVLMLLYRILHINVYGTHKLEVILGIGDDTRDDIAELDTNGGGSGGKYNVLISSYMRSGSTLAGRIFSRRLDTMFLIEPFKRILRWWYLHGVDEICRSDRLECRSSDGSHGMALQMLNNFFSCKFDEHIRFLPQYNYLKRGPDHEDKASCIQPEDRNECFKTILPEICKNVKHLATKTLRLSTDLLADLLREQKTLKVIHLFRDPRAIINSRLQTPWYKSVIGENITGNVRCLCKKMLYDFREGKKLQKVYPSRFRFIFYEDLIKRPLQKVKTLYRYLGMDLNESKYPVLETEFRTAVNQSPDDSYIHYAFQWRKSLKFETGLLINFYCKEVLKELGYRYFETLNDFRNMSLESVSIPNEYLIT